LQELIEFDDISFEIIGGIHLSWDADEVIVVVKVTPGSLEKRYQILQIGEEGLLNFFGSRLNSLEQSFPDGPSTTFPEFLKDYYMSLCCKDPTESLPEYF
jgi:hypothetical protein